MHFYFESAFYYCNFFKKPYLYNEIIYLEKDMYKRMMYAFTFLCMLFTASTAVMASVSDEKAQEIKKNLTDYFNSFGLKDLKTVTGDSINFNVDGELSVQPKGTYYLITFPAVTVTVDELTVKTNQFEATLTPKSVDGDYDIATQLPVFEVKPDTVSKYNVEFQDQSLTAVWSSEYNNFSDFTFNTAKTVITEFAVDLDSETLVNTKKVYMNNLSLNSKLHEESGVIKYVATGDLKSLIAQLVNGDGSDQAVSGLTVFEIHDISFKDEIEYNNKTYIDLNNHMQRTLMSLQTNSDQENNVLVVDMFEGIFKSINSMSGKVNLGAMKINSLNGSIDNTSYSYVLNNDNGIASFNFKMEYNDLLAPLPITLFKDFRFELSYDNLNMNELFAGLKEIIKSEEAEEVIVERQQELMKNFLKTGDFNLDELSFFSDDEFGIEANAKGVFDIDSDNVFDGKVNLLFANATKLAESLLLILPEVPQQLERARKFAKIDGDNLIFEIIVKAGDTIKINDLTPDEVDAILKGQPSEPQQ